MFPTVSLKYQVNHGCCRLVENSDVIGLDRLTDVMTSDIHMFSAALIVAIVDNMNC